MWRGGGKQKIYTLWCSYIFIVHKRKYFNAFLWRYSAPIWLACVSKVGLCYLESCGFGYFLGNLDERNCQTFEEKENYWEIYVSKKIFIFFVDRSEEFKDFPLSSDFFGWKNVIYSWFCFWTWFFLQCKRIPCPHGCISFSFLSYNFVSNVCEHTNNRYSKNQFHGKNCWFWL